MIKKLLLSIGVFLCCVGYAYSQAGIIKGIVKDTDGNRLLADVLLIQEGVTINNTWTNNGEFQFTNVQPGTYDVLAKVLTGQSSQLSAIHVAPGQIIDRDVIVEMEAGEATILGPVIVIDKPSLVSSTETMQVTTLDRGTLVKNPGRDATKALASSDGVASIDGNIMSVRGNRSDGQVVMIDGVRMRGNTGVNMQAMEAAQLIQGGIPAEYGDGTSFQVYHTRGVPKKFSTGIELRGSVDGYNNFLGAASILGPLTQTDSTTKVRMGFMLTGEAYYNKDSRPLRGGDWVAKDEVIEDLTKNPIRYSPTEFGAYYSEGSYLLEDAFEKKRVRQNADNWGFNIQGKIDIQPIKSEDIVKANSLRISLNGSYAYGTGKDWSRSSSLFNVKNNGIAKNSTLRLYATLSHMVVSDTGFLKNLRYDLNVSYTKYNYEYFNSKLKDNIFAYGHIGKFKTYKAYTYELQESYTMPDGLAISPAYVLTNIYDSLVTYTPGPYNTDLSYYNLNLWDQFSPQTLNDYYGYQVPYNLDIYQQFGGLLNGTAPNSIYSMYNVPGIPTGSYSKQEQTSWGAKASLTMNLGNHELKLGFELDRPSSRSYGVGAYSLWTLMRQHANSHIAELDLENPILVGEDTVFFNRLINSSAQSTFDKNLREKLGYDVNGSDWIDVDNLDPETFDLSMFSAEELLIGTTGTGSMVSYFGYDYTGKNKYKKKTDINDFFNGKDENGVRTYNVGAYEPVYMAMYLQDRFQIRTLVFNVGVRIDRFDANQSVLKDPYLFRPAHNVGSILNSMAQNEQEAEKLRSQYFVDNASDDWVVYVNRRDETLDLTASNIIAYRNGDIWYDANGQEVTDADALLGANGGPILTDAIDQTLITKVDAKAFKDYEADWSIMPRLSFSFPVSDKSRFTAHYNIITSRPSNLQLNPVSYLFIEKYGKNQSNVISNPNLKAQRSIDYELGFAQLINEDAAINITAYYSEKRDMIQSYRYTQAYPSTYYSYKNQDFGTVQGFSLSFILREIKNVSLRAGYTIQFAKGTGSSASSNLAIIQSGQPNLRTLTNLEFDQRHRFNVNLAYTLGSGKDYIGPKSTKKLSDSTVREIRWLENLNFNLVFSAASGLPYSKSSIPYSGIGQGGSSRLSGSINGSHRPWTYQCDLRVDREFYFSGKKKDGTNRKSSMVVYVDVTNLFNFKNILSVYTFTGNADDDGYLTANEYQQQINSQVSVDSYKWFYGMSVKNPYNYSAPTRVSLGLQFQF